MLVKQLWYDENGAAISAELVAVSTVGVLGAVAGMDVMAEAVNAEFVDLAQAIRSLNQNYSIGGYSFSTTNSSTNGSVSAKTMVGGSSFTQSMTAAEARSQVVQSFQAKISAQGIQSSQSCSCTKSESQSNDESETFNAPIQRTPNNGALDDATLLKQHAVY